MWCYLLQIFKESNQVYLSSVVNYCGIRADQNTDTTVEEIHWNIRFYDGKVYAFEHYNLKSIILCK